MYEACWYGRSDTIKEPRVHAPNIFDPSSCCPRIRVLYWALLELGSSVNYACPCLVVVAQTRGVFEYLPNFPLWWRCTPLFVPRNGASGFSRLCIIRSVHSRLGPKRGHALRETWNIVHKHRQAETSATIIEEVYLFFWLLRFLNDCDTNSILWWILINTC